MILVLGGAGFMGSNFVLDCGEPCVVLDKLTYAGCSGRLPNDVPVHQGDIQDKSLIRWILEEYDIDSIVNFAAESHVDSSFAYPDAFMQNNVLGTLSVLEAMREHAIHNRRLPGLVHISTDEVYGSVEHPVDEHGFIHPGNPYAASKAAADAMVMAYINTHKVRAIIGRFSNFYGPGQYPEKLIPATVKAIKEGRKAKLHGNGSNVRQWLHVSDATCAIMSMLANGLEGEIYNFPGFPRTNLQVVGEICSSLRGEFTLVEDRPGNDQQYAMRGDKAERELGWRPQRVYEDALKQTVAWYWDHL